MKTQNTVAETQTEAAFPNGRWTIKADIQIHVGGISLIVPLTAAGWGWIKRNVRFESWQETAGGIACEPNMAAAIADGATQAGLCVA